ncbi:uncharacterized protein BP5553_02892 [Venustampulla echinocandica]|uniref:SET domain-containing protein n=1 Tax=Venustampulla echinocandica TaxID=2656787 RepID=A0A370TSN7_9HELO|nr:uncharacterized protein BP5553_02892 [Venustampulla echinocandica]RDL38552.1 hypothetical protein BP5553_02892 [Venustampulla echinocandica]
MDTPCAPIDFENHQLRAKPPSEPSEPSAESVKGLVGQLTDALVVVQGESMPSIVQATGSGEAEIESPDDPDDCGYEIRPTGTPLGDGMFATKNIKPGTVILSEPSLITLEVFKFQDHRMRERELAICLHRLSPTDKRHVESLDPSASILEIFDANAFWLQGKYMVRRLYREICKINHACKPNAVLHHKEDGAGEVHALHPISKGTQIHIHYLSLGVPKAQVEDKYGFACRCNACLGIETDSEALDALGEPDAPPYEPAASPDGQAVSPGDQATSPDDLSTSLDDPDDPDDPDAPDAPDAPPAILPVDVSSLLDSERESDFPGEEVPVYQIGEGAVYEAGRERKIKVL